MRHKNIEIKNTKKDTNNPTINIPEDSLHQIIITKGYRLTDPILFEKGLKR